MWKIFVFSVLVFVDVQSQDKMGGRGKWQLLNTARCDGDDRFSIKVDVTKHKCGRTMDCFDGKLKFDREIGESMGVRIDVSKAVDGGAFQDYQVLMDDSIVRFIKKYAEKNMINVFTLAGFDPPDFPIPAGEMVIEGYPFNFCEMPEKAVYGEFKAKCFLLDDSVEIACVEFHLRFDEMDDDVECEDVE